MVVATRKSRADAGTPHASLSLGRRFEAVRAQTLALAAPLSAEDAMLQSMPDASPAKWHLAHTTWFFEQFVLSQWRGHVPFDPAFVVLFNSYYEAVGPRHARPYRGLLSRPPLARVLAYRHHVDARVQAMLQSDSMSAELMQRVRLGLEHEQQHQELLLTDIKHAFSLHPDLPAYRSDLAHVRGSTTAQGWCEGHQGAVDIGAPNWPDAEGFAFDHESPPHRTWLIAHALADRPVSNGEFGEFLRDGGYRTASLWLSAGWEWRDANAIAGPLYWNEAGDAEFTLAGERALDAAAPVAHVSYFEADAFARWASARLPTESEWESAAARLSVAGNFLESGALHPRARLTQPDAPLDRAAPSQLFGDVWEWTASAYLPYPGYRPLPGALGEYNGKFMSGQCVLRGGSCASAASHLRASYRNFFPPDARWQFSGIRLARDL